MHRRMKKNVQFILRRYVVQLIDLNENLASFTG